MDEWTHTIIQQGNSRRRSVDFSNDTDAEVWLVSPSLLNITGQDIHSAFIVTMNEEWDPPPIDIVEDWNALSGLTRRRYEKMAASLNDTLSQRMRKVDPSPSTEE